MSKFIHLVWLALQNCIDKLFEIFYAKYKKSEEDNL